MKKIITRFAVTAMSLAVLTPSLALAITPDQQAAINSISGILTNVTGQMQLMVADRNQQNQQLVQMQTQLAGVAALLQQGAPSADTLRSASQTVAAMSSQVSAIATRRAQENQVLAAAQSVLTQLASWLATLR